MQRHIRGVDSYENPSKNNNNDDQSKQPLWKKNPFIIYPSRL